MLQCGASLARLHPVNAAPNFKYSDSAYKQVFFFLGLDPFQHPRFSGDLDELRDHVSVQNISQNSTFLGFIGTRFTSKSIP